MKQSVADIPPVEKTLQEVFTRTEVEITALVAQNFTMKQIAERRGTSEQTVKNQLHHMYEKLGIANSRYLDLDNNPHSQGKSPRVQLVARFLRENPGAITR